MSTRPTSALASGRAESSAVAAGGTAVADTLEASGATGNRIAALDGLRALAVLLVVAMHYYVTPPGPDTSAVHHALLQVFNLGFAGVDLFLVLSGFFIGGILLDHAKSPQLMRGFYGRRFFRIMPVYLVLLASFLIAREIPTLAAVNRGTYFTSTVPEWQYFAFLQNFGMAAQRDIGPYWLGPTWSLAVEEQFYLLMPFLLPRLSRRPAIALCVTLIVASPFIRYAAFHYANNDLAAVFLLPSRADGLLWGVLCAVTVRTPTMFSWVERRRGLLWTLMAVLAVPLVGLSLRRAGAGSPDVATWGYSVLSAFFAALVLLVATARPSALTRTLGARPLASIGLGSYFIYLFHIPVWYVCHWAFFKKPPLHLTWAAGGVTALALAVTLLLAAVSWLWFEGPLLRFARRRFAYE